MGVYVGKDGTKMMLVNIMMWEISRRDFFHSFLIFTAALHDEKGEGERKRKERGSKSEREGGRQTDI